MYHWKKGISLSFFYDMRGADVKAVRNVLQSVKNYGFDCVELSFSHEDYFQNYHFTEGRTAEEWRWYCDSLGLESWSIHLPFSETWDLSRDGAKEALRDDISLIEAAARAGISVAVIHPSFEPIADQERGRRLQNAGNHLRLLNQAARANGVILALENLPRTCLGNGSEELIALLEDTETAFVFDTNHSLKEDNVSFLQRMLKGGHCPVSLHMSDYDFVDERHALPGDGVNPWRKLLEMLKSAGYNGPALYEINPLISPGHTITLEELAGNINRLLAGEIP